MEPLLVVRKHISVYADGSSTGLSDGPMGWGWVIVDNGADDFVVSSGSAGAPIGTNNMAELHAAIAGLRSLIDMKLHIDNDVELVSDSMYCLGLANGSYHPQKNQDIVKVLRELYVMAGARTRWVRGHSGDVFNDRCDELAKQGRDKYTTHDTKKRRRSRKREERRRKRAIVKAYKVKMYGFKPGRRVYK